MERTLQLLWVLDYLPDIEADFLAFYGIDDYEDYHDSAKFFRLTFRTTAFTGAMQARALEEQEKLKKGGNSPAKPMKYRNQEVVNEPGKQKALLRSEESGGQYNTVRASGDSYLKERLKHLDDELTRSK